MPADHKKRKRGLGSGSSGSSTDSLSPMTKRRSQVVASGSESECETPQKLMKDAPAYETIY